MSQAFRAVARAVHCVRRSGVLVLAVLAGVAQAQVSDWATSNCPTLQEPAQLALVRLCNGHAGCAIMVAQQGNSCPRIERFLSTLDAAIGPTPPPSSGFGGLLGVLGIRRVTPEAVWQASLPDAAKALESRPEWKELIDRIAKAVPAGAGLLNEGTNARGVRFVSYASGTSSASPLNGPITTFFANGIMRRGIWASGKFDLTDVVILAGQRITVVFGPDGATDQGRERERTGNEFVGTFNRDTLAWLNGTMTRPDGRREEGAFVDDTLRQGKQFRADGTLAAEGTFDRNGLSVGRRYDASGTTVVENVDVARAQAEAATAAREAAERQRREQEAARLAEEQRRAAEAAREQQAFRASLSSMNPGQLFNRADELQAAGNTSRANEVRRALIERFPNHPLAATAAQQLAGGSPSSGSSAAPSAAASARPSGGMSCRDAVSRLQEALNAAGNERRFLDSAQGNQVQEQILWVTSFYSQAVNRLPQCASDPAYRKRFDDDLAATRQNCPGRTRGPANCSAGANYYLDERQVQAVFQQLMGGSAVAGGQATGTGATASSPSQCRSSQADTMRQFDAAVADWRTRNPNPGVAAGAASGARAQNQYIYFFGVEGLKILEGFRPCLSAADYDANRRALEGARDQGLENCRRLSTDPSSCVPRMPS
jgi:hypothetical protein